MCVDLLMVIVQAWSCLLQLSDALKLAKQAVVVTKDHWLLPRAHQMLGACYASLAQQEINRSQHKEYHQLAVKNMQE